VSRFPRRAVNIISLVPMRSNSKADLLARILNSTGYFRGKVRLADLLGRLACSWNDGRGTFPLTNGKTVTIDLNDRIQRLMWGAAYEPDVRRCLSALLRPGDTFVDVGSHIGFFSLIASSLVGCTGKVYAFEADSALFEKLRANASEYAWLVVSLRAVWRESGSVSFSNPQQAGESGWGKLAFVRNEGHIASVEAVSLDEWHESVGCAPVRLIKIDAEGSEPFILESARRIIASARPFLIVELNDQLLREVGRPKEIVASALRDQGYRIFAMGSGDLIESDDLSDLSSPEILCVPSDRLEETERALPRLRTGAMPNASATRHGVLALSCHSAPPGPHVRRLTL
jgi:FkbM family methyltransferase